MLAMEETGSKVDCFTMDDHTCMPIIILCLKVEQNRFVAKPIAVHVYNIIMN